MYLPTPFFRFSKKKCKLLVHTLNYALQHRVLVDLHLMPSQLSLPHLSKTQIIFSWWKSMDTPIQKILSTSSSKNFNGLPFTGDQEFSLIRSRFFLNWMVCKINKIKLKNVHNVERKKSSLVVMIYLTNHDKLVLTVQLVVVSFTSQKPKYCEVRAIRWLQLMKMRSLMNTSQAALKDQVVSHFMISFLFSLTNR